MGPSGSGVEADESDQETDLRSSGGTSAAVYADIPHKHARNCG
jgi:hypothetical protein